MIFHSEFKMIPRRQGESSGGVYENTLSMLTTQPTQVGLEYGMESAYDAASRRTTRTLPNGTTTTYNYDNDSRLTAITTTKDTNTIDSTTYTLDGVGNRLTKAQPQQSITTSYAYDDIYRLTQANPTGGSYLPEAYTYDQVGNRLTTINDQIPTNNETTTYTYDDENRLTGVQITSNNLTRQINFSYDPFGRRIKKTVSPSGGGVGEETTTYVYDNHHIILEYDNSNNVKTRYTHGPTIDEPLAIEIKGTTTFTPYYYHADGLGSIIVLTDTSGNIVQRYEYDSFGNQVITTNGNISQPYTFTSREYDTETEMYFYRARYYDSKVGRFVTKDPIGFDGGINQYVYVLNNPMNRTDPDGLYSGPCGNAKCTWVSDYPVGFNFTDPCDKHDKCYDCKGKQEGKTKAQCDREFLVNMMKKCTEYSILYSTCTSVALYYYAAVVAFGNDDFNNARRNCCNN